MSDDEYTIRYDADALFWQILNGLRQDDLISELIQNELDAGANRTLIHFGERGFFCEGDGIPIDANGWKRLSFMLGAGQEAPRKRHRFGVKNHGLKTCFTFGDEIVISSDGKAFKQTLYKNGAAAPPAPGTFKKPISDSSAPLTGCRIAVPYRSKPLITTLGERLEFAVPDKQTIEDIFHSTCAEIPQRFIGAIRPGIREAYTIELRHHRLGARIFTFRCARSQPVRGGRLFTRSCEGRGDTRELPSSLREGAFFFTVPLSADSAHEIPSFYQVKGGFASEVAWQLNASRKPIAASGHLRYPIAYTGTGESARTGLGVHFSGPFISDQERHGISSAPFNHEIVDACTSALIELMRDHLIAKVGAGALRLLVDPTNFDRQRLVRMTEALLTSRAIPLARQRRGRIQFGPGQAEDGAPIPVVVPTYTWEPGKISAELVSLCPPEFDQVNPRIPTEILQVLAGEECAGWQETRVTFDEHDVIKRLQPTQEKAYYPWNSQEEWQSALGDYRVAKTCLDVLLAFCDNKHVSVYEIEQLRESIHLPDAHDTARPMCELFIGNKLPTTLASLRMPPLLHPKLGAHRLLKRRAWKPKTYTFESFFEALDLVGHSDAIYRELWTWLHEHWKSIPKKSLYRVAELPIWPTRDGSVRKLKELCLPRDARIATVLSDTIHLPATDVLHLRAVRRKGRGALVLRSKPSPAELQTFYFAQLSAFTRERPLDHKEVARFRAFEQKLVVLASDKEIAGWICKQSALALDKNRWLQPIGELHRESALTLMNCDLLDRPSRLLDKIFPPRTQPSVEAIIRALERDGTRSTVLIRRLRAFSEAKHREGKSTATVADIACIPVEDQFLPPARLALKGNHGDFWGDWKLTLSGKGLSADVQDLYRKVGVTGGEPNPDTSLAFFNWLNAYPASELPRHLEAIIRHFAHKHSVTAWWNVYPDIPCLPVQLGTELRLVSHKFAVRPNSAVFLPDFPELAETIRSQPPNEHIMLAIVTHLNVAEPIIELLRKTGVRSLRQTASTPLNVTGDNPKPGSANLLQIVQDLCSSKMTNLRKRLARLELPMRYLHEHWRSHIEHIKTIMLADRVHAAFRLGRRVYRIEVDTGFDESSSVIWLKGRSEQEIDTVLFEALARRVFTEGTPRYAAYVLQQAFRQEFRETIAIDIEAVESENSQVDTPSAEPGESRQTHRSREPDPSKNLPRPGPIPQNSRPGVGRSLHRTVVAKAPAKRSSPEIELLHEEELKQNQYAWHCQICLALKSPHDLAPAGSYVEFSESRHKIIEAHHADQVHASGARHAGNLIVLCHYHHHRFGNKLSREQITHALNGRTVPKRITFFSPSNRVQNLIVEGLTVAVHISSSNFAFNFYITTAHRDFWLSTARPEA